MSLNLSAPVAPAAGPASHRPPASDQRLRRFDLWVENSHEVTAEVTLDGRIAYLSPNVRAVLGYDSEEALGSQILALVHPEDLPQLQAHFAAPVGWVTCRVRHDDGSWRWLEASGRKFLSASGEERLWITARDVTGRKLAEDESHRLAAQLQHAQKFEVLGTLASGIAHDFNNLLTAIMINTDLIRLETAGNPTMQERLDLMRAASGRAKGLVQQILSFSRQQTEERQPVKLHAVINEVIKLLRSSLPATVEIRCDVRDTASLVLADPTQVHQLLMNLCTNSVHAMRSRRGRIDVRLDSLFVDQLYQRAEPKLREGGYVRLTVSDTGSGMDAGTLKRLFEPFFTTKEDGDGSGLGLAVVHRIIKGHRGAVHVSSQPGEGTTFEIFFPRHEAGGRQDPRVGPVYFAA